MEFTSIAIHNTLLSSEAQTVIPYCSYRFQLLLVYKISMYFESDFQYNLGSQKGEYYHSMNGYPRVLEYTLILI